MAFMNEDSARGVGARCGFSLELSCSLPEIGGGAHVYRHDASGARLLLLDNDDANKAFSIAFKTPAADDTGVFHILEHSVLCGSRKFPVKEPFVTLLKSSMQTFLNAMTFPDKTVYPVASTNEQDLMNLMDVYMDAVFYPRIYANKRIFEQEGWHLELEGPCDAPDGEDALQPGQPDQPDTACADGFGNLIYNGVVYNEMKGALSDPDQVLYDALSEALFPDTTYRFESGGTPESIPSLTYEQFLSTHNRHYSPENSYIVLYGDLDAERFMGYIDAEYLSPIAASRTAGHECCCDCVREPIGIALQEPVCNEGIRREMATAPDNSCTAFGYVVGGSDERERIAAAAVLLDAIMGSNEAPLKRALLDAHIADDFSAYMSDSILQPFVVVSARGLSDRATERMRDVIERTISELSGSGGDEPALDESLVEAAISHSEFTMREYDFGYPDGVSLSVSAMSGWLYDDSPAAAISYLQYEELFAKLRSRLGCGYYAELLREIFLGNDHRAQVEVVPVERGGVDAQSEGLAKMREGMDVAQLLDVAGNAKALREAQMAPDDPADMAKLPHLTRADIGEAPSEPAVALSSIKGHVLLRHEVETHGIAYFTQLFDLSPLRFEEVGYASVLALLLGKLGTAKHSAAQIDTLVQSNLGSFHAACEVLEVDESADDGRACRKGIACEHSRAAALLPKLTVAASCLESKVGEAAGLVGEILRLTDYSDTGRILDILIQCKVHMEQRFSTSGNSVAARRAASYIDGAYVLREQMSGIDFYVFLKRLISRIESGEEDMAARMSKLAERMFGSFSVAVSFGGSDAAYRAFESALELPNADEASGLPYALEVPAPVDRREAFAVPTDVTYSALVSDRGALSGHSSCYSGDWIVLSRILSYDYLWNEVRVVGGAYGVSFSMGRVGLASFTSYRDPHVRETLRRFAESASWLEEFDPSEDEFEGYVVSTAAGFDAPVKPRSLIRRQAVMALVGYTHDMHLRYRKQVMEASVSGVRRLASAVDALCGDGRACVVGNRGLLGELEDDVVVVDLLEM